MSGHVVCVGLATLDSIFALPRHPAADDRVVATELAVAGGGPAATAAVTLARLGADVSFVGVVGDDASGVAIRDGLDREGVDVSEVAVVAGGRSPQSSILVEGVSRAIVHYPGNLPRVELSRRALGRCRAAAWVHVDHAGYAAAPRDARLSIDGGNPIEDLDLEGVALYGPSDVGLERDFGSAAHALSAGAELVVVTRGAQGSAAYSRDGVVEAEAIPIESAVSTLGAGDVFHGALLARLLEDAPIAAALAFANTCAALSTRALDGRSAIPTPEEVG